MIDWQVDFQGTVYKVSGLVEEYLMRNQKIQAIKQLRQEYSLDLRSAKQLVDMIDLQFSFPSQAKQRKDLGEDFKIESCLIDSTKRLVDLLNSLEARINRLERRNIDVNKTEELRRLIEMQSDRLTAQSHRMDKLCKEMAELRVEMEKRPIRRVILRKKEQE